jgi:hypothetical protein
MSALETLAADSLEWIAVAGHDCFAVLGGVQIAHRAAASSLSPGREVAPSLPSSS